MIELLSIRGIQESYYIRVTFDPHGVHCTPCGQHGEFTQDSVTVLVNFVLCDMEWLSLDIEWHSLHTKTQLKPALDIQWVAERHHDFGSRALNDSAKAVVAIGAHKMGFRKVLIGESLGSTPLEIKLLAFPLMNASQFVAKELADDVTFA
ncbi:hypothetical protein [Paraburkholderia caribensis]|uniref:hypothetical protein n=1 Tax=Paraburkholderia caribensis TaxID=75105 RepID=UPI00286600AE|nr:hypothetical protein [Paraburkholderia caribensis]MDR6385101.1 hypothetical protein [Paraburkholderia caribensis]